MQRRVFLHVGLPKSGTTFVQKALAENKQELIRRAGLLYPAESWTRQVAAVRDVRGMPDLGQGREVHGAWQELVDEINAWPGDAVVSMEWLCRAEPEQIRRILDDLRPAEVEAVFTVRDLARTIPAAWQESVQNRHTWSWAEFLDGVTAHEPELSSSRRRFWRLHDVVDMLGVWGQVLPPERLHVITVPRPGQRPALLWERFCQVLDIDAEGYVVDGLGGNPSLGLDSVELLRRLNSRARARRIPRTVHKRVITQGLAKRGLAQRGLAQGEQPARRLVLPPELHPWVRDRAAEETRGIEAARVHVVGDLAELRPALAEEPGPQPEDVADADLLDAALDGLVILVEQGALETSRVLEEFAQETSRREAALSRLTREKARLKRRNTQLERRNAEARRRLERLDARPVRSALGVYRRRQRSPRALPRAVARRMRSLRRKRATNRGNTTARGKADT